MFNENGVSLRWYAVFNGCTMDVYDIFTTPEEGETLRKCGISPDTASFASIRNAPKDDYSFPVVVPSVSKHLIDKISTVDSNMIIPVWCMNDLIQIMIDRKMNINIPFSNPGTDSKRKRIAYIVSYIDEMINGRK